MSKYLIIFSSFILLIVTSCKDCNKCCSQKTSDKKSLEAPKKNANLLTDYTPLLNNGDVNAVIEIPAGTLEKWELNKSTGQIEWETINNTPRIVNYVGYPGNYGMIPKTLLSKERGGDEDPLDIIVLGPPAERGSVIPCKLIGVLYLLDNGEHDDKLIAVSENSPLYQINNISELDEKYIGISEILKLWFTNYKGPKQMESKGFGDKNKAIEILKIAISDYELYNQIKNKK